MAQDLCLDSPSPVQMTLVPWGLKSFPLIKPSRCWLPTDALCQAVGTDWKVPGLPCLWDALGPWLLLVGQWGSLLREEDWSQLPLQPFPVG